jgi:hypothetical protein
MYRKVLCEIVMKWLESVGQMSSQWTGSMFSDSVGSYLSSGLTSIPSCLDSIPIGLDFTSSCQSSIHSGLSSIPSG